MKVHKLLPIVALTILAAIAGAAPITIPGLYSTGTAGEGALDPIIGSPPARMVPCPFTA